MYSMGNTVNKIIMTLHGDRRLLDLYDSHIVRYSYVNVKSLRWTPETNMILYALYTLINNKIFKIQQSTLSPKLKTTKTDAPNCRFCNQTTSHVSNSM